MTNSFHPSERPLAFEICGAIGMSRAGYNGVDCTCISTSLPVDRVEAVLRRICDLSGNTIIDYYDYAERDDNRLDVRGYSDVTPENDFDWRIMILCAGSNAEG